jgi:hypothetical protein
MAEEVKIVDVAGGPAAEATLQELLKVMKGSSGGTGGGGPSDAASKASDLYTTAVTRGTKSQAKNTKGLDKSTTALEKMASAVGGMVKGTFGLLKNVLGGMIGISTNLVKAFGDGTGTLTDMVSAIPGIGSILGMFTGYLDNTLTVFQQLSSSGASFNNNLTLLRVSAAGAKVSLESFAGLIGQNTEGLAAFGGTVTQGAIMFGKARTALNKYEGDLLNMGLTFEEINEGLMDYMTLNRAGSRGQQQDMAALAEGSAMYSKSLMTLSKLAGKDIKAQKEALAAKQNDIAFQMQLAKLRPEERAKVQAGLAEALAAGGDVGAEYFKQQFLGMPPLTSATQMFVSTMGDSATAIRAMHEQATNTGVTMEQFSAGTAGRLADFIEGQAKAGASMETMLMAAGAGLDGPAGEIAQIMNDMGIKFTDYTDENGNFNREKFLQDAEAAKKENDKRDEAAKGLLAFQQTLRNIKLAFETNIVAPITEAVGPQLKLLGEAFSNANSTTLTPFIEKIGAEIEKVTADINKFGVAGALDSLITRIGVAAKPVFTGMMDTLSRFIFGETKTDMEARLNETKADLESQSAEIDAQIKALQTELPNLSGAAADAATKQIQGLEQQLANVGRQIGETQVEIDGAEDSSGLFGDTFSTIWESIKEMDWGTVAISLGVMGAAIVALGFAAKPVVLPLIAIGAAAAGIGYGASGIADLIDSITGSVGKLADGVKKFEDLDSGKLLDVGNALGPLTTNIMDLAKGGIVASFVGEGALEGLAAGVKSFEGLDAATLTPIGAAIQGLGDPIKEIASAGFFANFVSDGALEGLAKGVKSFEGLDVKGLTATGPALAALQQGIAAFTGDGVLDSVSKGVGGFISSLFGGEEGQFDALIEGLKKFEEVNADAIHKVGTGLQGLSEFATSDVDLGQINFSADGLERLNDITKTLDAGAITKYNEALEKLVEVLGELNTELSGANVPGATGGGATSGPSPAANALGNVSGSNSNSATERLNMLVSQLVELQTENNRIGGKTVKALGGNMQA